MGIFSSLSKGIQAVIDDVRTPQSFKTGEEFENYVRDFLFTSDCYDILERTHSFKTNQDYVESSLKPDFTFRDRRTKKEFYVEAKFRTGLYNNKIVWCNDKQLSRYLDYNRKKPVFLILGMGDNPKYPELLSLIPLAQAKYTGLFPFHAEKFEIKIDTSISSKELWAR